MTTPQRTLRRAGSNLMLAARALRAWGPRQVGIATAFALGFALLVGIATVLIPNPLFARDIETVWWNYPVWIVTSIGAGLLAATYVRPRDRDRPQAGEDGAADLEPADARHSARMGIVGGLLTWFAVGCPVCNKIALLALGYSGAITWFAPVQPWLAAAALLLTYIALVWRLKGQVACSVPARRRTGRSSAIGSRS